MSRLQPVQKSCLQCNKTFFAKRSDAKFCSDICRAVNSSILRAKPVLKEEVINDLIERLQAMRYSITIEPKGKLEKLVSRKKEIIGFEIEDGLAMGFDKDRLFDIIIEQLKEDLARETKRVRTRK